MKERNQICKKEKKKSKAGGQGNIKAKRDLHIQENMQIFTLSLVLSNRMLLEMQPEPAAENSKNLSL